ncbi:hypothetical protein ACIQUM_33145 [Amycolatopsis azurea]|uniref:hypothetical protein n=1 Tax=Amycolatopsis azurea TaxID=36819 RepID=UPI003807679C
MGSTITKSVRGRAALTALALGALVAGGVGTTAGTATAAIAENGKTISINGNWDPWSVVPRLKLGQDAGIGPVPGGLAGVDVPAIAPEGTEVSALEPDPGMGLTHMRGARAPRSAGGV